MWWKERYIGPPLQSAQNGHVSPGRGEVSGSLRGGGELRGRLTTDWNSGEGPSKNAAAGLHSERKANGRFRFDQKLDPRWTLGTLETTNTKRVMKSLKAYK